MLHKQSHTSESQEEDPPFVSFLIQTERKCKDEAPYAILSGSLCTISRWVSEEH